jgi:hypothetical protein
MVKVVHIKRCDKHVAQMWKTSDVYRILVRKTNETDPYEDQYGDGKILSQLILEKQVMTM